MHRPGIQKPVVSQVILDGREFPADLSTAGAGLYYRTMSRFLIAALFLVPASTPAADLVPAWLIRLPESTQTVFIAETAESALHRFDRSRDGVIEASRAYMSIGRGGIGKRTPGDRRTPLGIYFVTERLDTTRLHEKYGAMAFPLDYPNAWDRRLGRSGDGIWVHGVDRRGGVRPPLDTDGCIAIPNDRLRALAPRFEPNVTPVLIATGMQWAPRGTVAEIRAALEQAVARWALSLQQGDLFSWLDTYDDSFEHWGMDKDEWATFSLATIGSRPLIEVLVDELLLLGDPQEEGLYLSRFRLELHEAGRPPVISMHRIYWRRAADGAFRIVAEDSG